MSLSVVRVPTHSASRYLQQLAKHWSHKMTVVFSEEEGRIDFPGGSHLVMRADSESLDLELSVPEGEDADRMREVVENHIDRFASREAPLTCEWR